MGGRLAPKKTLTLTIFARKSCNRERNFRTQFAPLLVPTIFREKICGEATGDCEFRREWFTNRATINCPRHGIEQIAHQNAFEFLPTIKGRNEIDVLGINGMDKPLYPIGLNRGGVGRKYHAHSGTEQVGGGEDGAKSEPMIGDASIFCADRGQSAQGIDLRSAPHIIDRNPRYQLRSAILRAAVGIDDDGSFARKALKKSGLDGLKNGRNSSGVVVSGKADEDVNLADIYQLAKKFIA